MCCFRFGSTKSSASSDRLPASSEKTFEALFPSAILFCMATLAEIAHQ
jgi:hypothetical protein